jgi:hypothetical protein
VAVVRPKMKLICSLLTLNIYFSQDVIVAVDGEPTGGVDFHKVMYNSLVF